MIYPIIFAHRGANSFAPENSLPAFQKALDLGCHGIELDIRFTADEKIVVFHDRNTDRMTGVRRNIHRLTLNEIQELRLTSENNSTEKIPILAEVLDLAGREILVNIDVKKETISRNGFEEKLAALLSDFRLSENIIVSSFNPVVLKRIGVLKPDLKLGYIFRNRSSLLMLNGQPIHSLHARHRILSGKYMKHLRERRLEIYGWTVDSPLQMLDLIDKQVDGIISNRPELFFSLQNKIISREPARKKELRKTLNLQPNAE